MTSPLDLSLERKKRSNDAGEMTPEELLRWALQDVNEGDAKGAKRALVVLFVEYEGRLFPQIYRAGMNQMEAVAHAEIAKLAMLDTL